MESDFGCLFLSGLGNNDHVGNVSSMGCLAEQQCPPLLSPAAGGKAALDDKSFNSGTPAQTDDDDGDDDDDEDECINSLAEEASTPLSSTDSSEERRDGMPHHHVSFEDNSAGAFDNVSLPPLHVQRRSCPLLGVDTNRDLSIDRIALGKTSAPLLRRAFTAPIADHEQLLPDGWKQQTEPFGEVSVVHDRALDGLHNLFDRYWNLIDAELQRSTVAQEKNDLARLVGQPGVFLVQLPTGYQGLQCRKSLCVSDRHMRFVANGATVVGILIEEGKWLQLSRKVFLPTHVGPIQVLQPQPHSESIVQRYLQQEGSFQSWVHDIEHTRSIHRVRSLKFGIFSWCNSSTATAE